MNKRSKHFNIKINNTDITYLYIRKNACSAWKKVFVNESPHAYQESENKNPIRFMGKHHLVSAARARKSAYRIVVLREPLGRIVSAYINQFVSRIDERTEFHLQVSNFINKPIEDITFRDFVDKYLLTISNKEVNNHFWSQKSHFGDVNYNKVILLQNLYRDTRKLFGKPFADKYFKKKVNATSNVIKYEVDACDITAQEMYLAHQAGKGWPSTNSFLKDKKIYTSLVKYCKEDIKLYESHLKGKVAMIVWNEFTNDARVLREANSLNKNGYAVTVNALHTPGRSTKAEVLNSGVKVKRVSRSFLSRLIEKIRSKKPVRNQHVSTTNLVSKNTISKMAHFVRFFANLTTHITLCVRLISSKPTIIHAHDINVLTTAWIASKLLKVPLIYDAHEISTHREGYQKIRSYIGFIEKKLMPKAEATITTTDMRAKFLARSYGIKRPTVLQNRPSYYELKDSTRIRDELMLTERWPIVLYQGGLQAGRGLEMLVMSAQGVNNAYFVFIGSGRLESKLKKLANELEVENRVKFIPMVSLSDLPKYTASADIGIQPIQNTCLNHYSTDSNKLFEYVLAGLPVVATDFPEIREIVNRYQVGMLFDESLDGLTSAINKLVQAKRLREQYKTNALEARKELSWESQEQALVELYNNIKVTNKA
ncbi:MAG TPA: glycosyltransferase [Kangiella sp.]